MQNQAKFKEPDGSFPYKRPSADLIKRFAYLNELPKKPRRMKRIFDIVVSLILLILLAPILLLIFVLAKVEAIFSPSSRGPFFYYYLAKSNGQTFKKWKVRQFKMDAVDFSEFGPEDWRTYACEWEKGALTKVGTFVKRFYLDELPQIFTIFSGQMSFVGPRPLAAHHYTRDLDQGNFTRLILPGGLLGAAQSKKGTSQFGDPIFDFEYAEIYLQGSWLRLMAADLSILLSGLKVALKGGGH